MTFKFPDRKPITIPDLPELMGQRVAGFLKGMGIDLREVTKFIGEIAGELKEHNDRAQRVEDKIDRLLQSQEAVNDRVFLIEETLVCAVPEARMILGDAAALRNNPATRQAYIEKGMMTE